MKASLLKAVVFLSFFSLRLNAEVPVDSFTTIDAFTSASMYHSCTLFTSKVYKDRAELNWQEYWANDPKIRTYRIKWGTAQNVYTDSLNLSEFLAECDRCMPVKTIVLNNLLQGTKYFVLIHRDYNGDLYNRDFIFTTPPLDPIPPILPDDIGYLNPAPVIFLKPTSAPTSSKAITSVKITTINGRVISHFPYISSQNTEATLTGLKLASGVYLATFLDKRKSAVVSTRYIVD